MRFRPRTLILVLGFGFSRVFLCLLCADTEEFEGEEHWVGAWDIWWWFSSWLRGILGGGWVVVSHLVCGMLYAFGRCDEI